jgi:hypothetical protein
MKKILKMSLKKIYKEIYNVSTNKKDFIENMSKEFPLLKITTIERRYYEFNHLTPDIISLKHISSQFILDDEIKEPSQLQQLLIQDAKRFKYKITRQFLEQHGFRPYEINWLIKRNEVYDDREDSEV